MRFWNVLVVMVFALGLVLGGCKGKDEGKKEEAKKEAKKAEAKKEEPKADEKKEEPKADEKKEEPKADEKKDEAKADEKKDEAKADEKKEEPKADEKKEAVVASTGSLGAKETVELAIKSVQSKDITPIIGLIPPKYIADIEGITHAFANAMDKELFDKFVGLLDKTFKIAVAQKDALAQMAAGFGVPVQADDVKKAIDATAEVWGMLKAAGLTDLEKLKTFKLGAFVQADLPKITDKFWALADGSQKAQVDAALAVLGTAKVEVLETEKKEKWGEVVKLEVNVAGEKEKFKMVQVEGKWVPKDMAEEWDEGMLEAHKGIKEMAEELPKAKAEAMAQLAQFETVLDQVEKSGDLSALQGLGAMMGMPGAGMAPPPVPDVAPAVDGGAAAPEAKKEEAPKVEEKN